MNEKFRKDIEQGMSKALRSKGGDKKIWASMKADGIEVPNSPGAIGVELGDYPLVKKYFLELWGLAGIGDIAPVDIFNHFRVGDFAGAVALTILGMSVMAIKDENKKGYIRFVRAVEDYFVDNEERVFDLDAPGIDKSVVAKFANTMLASVLTEGEGYLVDTLTNFWILREHMQKKGEQSSEDLRMFIMSNMRIPWVLAQDTSQVIASLSSFVHGHILDRINALIFIRALGADKLVLYADDLMAMNNEALFHAQKLEDYQKFCELSQIKQLLVGADENIGASIIGKYQDLFFRARSVIGNSKTNDLFHYLAETERKTLNRLLSNQYLAVILVNAGLVRGEDFINLTKKWVSVIDLAKLPEKAKEVKSKIEPQEPVLMGLLNELIDIDNDSEKDGNQEN